jgi:hypothetical protein
LAGLVFPLGELRKGEVKAIARELGWGDLAEKEESQDFIECKDYSVLFRKGDAKPGDFVTREGTVLGRHRGILHYTIGQRKGLELGGGGTPWHVLEIDAERNRVVVGPREDLQASAAGGGRSELGVGGVAAGGGASAAGADPPAPPRGGGDRVGGREGAPAGRFRRAAAVGDAGADRGVLRRATSVLASGVIEKDG